MAACDALLDILLGAGLGGCVRHRLRYALARHVTGEDGRATLHSLQALNSVVSTLVVPTEAPLLVAHVVIVEPVPVAFLTIYAENVL